MIETRYNRNDTMKKIGDIVIEHDTMENMIHDLKEILQAHGLSETCLLYTSPSPRDS